jgi:hypothetical protein
LEVRRLENAGGRAETIAGVSTPGFDKKNLQFTTVQPDGEEEDSDTEEELNFSRIKNPMVRPRHCKCRGACYLTPTLFLRRGSLRRGPIELIRPMVRIT